VAQRTFVRSPLQTGWRALIYDRRLLLVIATVLIAGAYATHRTGAEKSDAMEVAGHAIGVGEHSAPTAQPAPPMPPESTPVEPETIAEFQAPAPTTSPEAPKRASSRQRPVPEVHARVGAIPPVKHHPATVFVGSPVANPANPQQPDPWQAMHASLARCSGDLFDRILCDQRVRQSFCEGHWGEAPECANGVTNDHGK